MSQDPLINTFPDEILEQSINYLSPTDLHRLQNTTRQYSGRTGRLARIAASHLKDGHMIVHQAGRMGKSSSVRPRRSGPGNASSDSLYQPIERITAVSSAPRDASTGYGKDCAPLFLNRILTHYLQTLPDEHSSTMTTQAIEVPLATGDEGFGRHPEHIPGFRHFPPHRSTGAQVTSVLLERNESGPRFFTLFSPKTLDPSASAAAAQTHDIFIGHLGDEPSQTFDKDSLYLAKIASNAILPLPAGPIGDTCAIVDFASSYDFAQPGARTEDQLRAAFIEQVAGLIFGNRTWIGDYTLLVTGQLLKSITTMEDFVRHRLRFVSSRDDVDGARATESVRQARESVHHARVGLGLDQE